MIDYLMQAGTMTALQNGPGKYNPDGRGPLYDTTSKQWRGDICFLCQVFDRTNPSKPVPLTGVFLWIGLPARDPKIEAMAGYQLCADRALGLRGDPNYLIYSIYTPAQRAVDFIVPVIAGAHYPFMSA